MAAKLTDNKLRSLARFAFRHPRGHKLRLCCTRPLAAKLTDNLGYWLVLLFATRVGANFACAARDHWLQNSPIRKPCKVFLFNGNHSTDLMFAAVSLLGDVNVQHSMLHLCLNLVGVGIIWQNQGLLELGV